MHPPAAKTVEWVQHLFLHYLFTYTYLFSLNIMSSNLLSACNEGDKLMDYKLLTFEFFSSICLLIYPPQFVRGFQPPSLRHRPLDPACRPLFKIFVPPPLFSFPLPFKVFQTVPSTLTQLPHALTRPNDRLWFKQISKGEFYQFNCCFISKINFNLINPFTNRFMGYFQVHIQTTVNNLFS